MLLIYSNPFGSELSVCVASLRQLDVEPASRNQQVIGGKGQKRKRSKKEVVKAPRKKRKGRPWRRADDRRPKSGSSRLVCL